LINSLNRTSSLIDVVVLRKSSSMLTSFRPFTLPLCYKPGILLPVLTREFPTIFSGATTKLTSARVRVQHCISQPRSWCSICCSSSLHRKFSIFNPVFNTVSTPLTSPSLSCSHQPQSPITQSNQRSTVYASHRWMPDSVWRLNSSQR